LVPFIHLLHFKTSTKENIAVEIKCEEIDTKEQIIHVVSDSDDCTRKSSVLMETKIEDTDYECPVMHSELKEYLKEETDTTDYDNEERVVKNAKKKKFYTCNLCNQSFRKLHLS
jgi:hypothetical protein